LTTLEFYDKKYIDFLGDSMSGTLRAVLIILLGIGVWMLGMHIDWFPVYVFGGYATIIGTVSFLFSFL